MVSIPKVSDTPAPPTLCPLSSSTSSFFLLFFCLLFLVSDLVHEPLSAPEMPVR